ncbi:cytochrome P450 [Rhizoctonia solani]|nr:cytochrome P450 [Rhizoctonia solani]
MTSIVDDYRTRAVTVAIGSVLLIRLGYSWLWPKPIPAIPHNPITSIWGDIPALIAANKEKKMSFVEFLSICPEYTARFVLIGRKAMVIISDKEEMKRILIEKKITDQNKRTQQMFATVIPNGQVSLPTDEKWKRHRRLTGPSMSRRYLERMSTRIAAGASDLVRLWSAKIDIVGSCCFEAGLDIQLATTVINITMGNLLGCVNSMHAALLIGHTRQEAGIAYLPRPELPPLYGAISRMMQSIDSASKSAFPSLYALIFSYASPSWRKQYNSISSFLNGAIVEARERESMTGRKGSSLAADADCVLDMIIQHEARGGAEKFEKGEILDELMMYVFAGQDTTASALRWLVKYFPTDPEIQQRLHEEVCDVFGQEENTDKLLDFDLLDDPERVPVLEAVVAETLRCAGVASLISREFLQDEMILGKFVPKGTDVMFATAMMGMDRVEWGPDANEWRPSRWLTTNGTFDRSAGPSFPFGMGQRSCFGQRLALLQLKHFVAAMSHSFFFKPVSQEVNSWEAVESITKQPKICYVSLEKWISRPTDISRREEFI